MPTVPAGGLVLITGANGYIGGVVIQKFLEAGYRVRGTVRDPSKNQWMLPLYGPKFELVAVPDMYADGAFDAAVKGVDGVAHIASAVVFQPDPAVVIPPYITSAVNILKSAAKEPSVKSVSYTSSQATMLDAAAIHTASPYSIGPDSWWEDAKRAWTEPPSSDFPRMLLNYACGKLEAEQACWKWVKDNKPHFTFNTIVPNINWGPTASPENTGYGSSSGLQKLLWNGSALPVSMIPPEWWIDTEDNGVLQIAALTLPGVENERILAIADKFCYNDVLAIFKKYAPEKKFLDKVEEKPDVGTVDLARAKELMRMMGKEFNTLDETIRKFVVQMLDIEKRGVVLPETEADRMAKMTEEAAAQAAQG
ncbi:NAD(P)-binding protein [Polyplosphaeria fusca]|uniref:NAD(P)-binding protein n=1 Tax=Polyplosphaeria fusca TaxID=682080 RepID=A0A9P4UUI3_9PLEO|nr:NAD(P)-binding protein [Polyplosphaeria fusca]